MKKLYNSGMETEETEQQAHDRKLNEIVDKVKKLVEYKTRTHRTTWTIIIIVQIIVAGITIYRAYQFEKWIDWLLKIKENG